MLDLVRRPRDPADVMRCAVIVGVVAAAPAAALATTAQSVLMEPARGGTWAQAWTAAGWTDCEDLETVPALAASRSGQRSPSKDDRDRLLEEGHERERGRLA